MTDHRQKLLDAIYACKSEHAIAEARSALDAWDAQMRELDASAQAYEAKQHEIFNNRYRPAPRKPFKAEG